MLVPQRVLRLRFWLAAVCLQAPKPGAIPNFAKPGNKKPPVSRKCSFLIIHEALKKSNPKKQKLQQKIKDASLETYGIGASRVDYFVFSVIILLKKHDFNTRRTQ